MRSTQYGHPPPGATYLPVELHAWLTPPGREAQDQFESSWVRPAILTVVAVKIAGLAVVFDPAGLQAFDFLKSSWSRGTQWVLAGLLVFGVLRFGPEIVPRTWLHASVVAYGLAAAVSGLAAINTYVAMHGEQDSYLGVVFVCDMLVLYLATAVAFRGTSDWRTLATTIAIAGVLSSLYAIAQFLGADPIRWSIDSRIRPFGTFGNPNQLAHYLSVAAGITLGSALFEREAFRRIAYGACAGLFVVTSGLTGARAGLLGFGVVVALALLIVARRQSRRVPRGAVLGMIAAATIGAAVVVASPAGQRLEEGPLADRVLLYRTALQAFLERPVLGFGPDQFEIAFVRYRPAGSAGILGQDVRHVWAHDWVLQALVTMGLAGTAALVLVLVLGSVYLFGPGLKAAPHVAGPLLLGWGAYWSQALLTVSSISIDWFPWVALGITAALVGGRRVATRRPLSAPARGALILVVVAGVMTGVPALAANREAGAARAYLAAGDPVPALSAAAAAVRLDPGRAVYWNWLGIASEALQRWDEAATSYGEAVARSGYVATYSMNVARAKAERSLASEDAIAKIEALDEARRALAIDPFDPATNRSFAEIALLLGDCDAAFHSTLDAYSLSGGDRRYVVGLSAAAACVGEPGRARIGALATLSVGETGEIRAALAVLYLRAGDVANARSNATRALELDASSPSALQVMDSIGR